MGLFDSLKSLVSGGRVNVAKRFALQRQAISGTMSKFYMAKDLSSGKIVGLKILDMEKTNAVEGRYKGLNKPSEGEIAMLLKHPRIVETYEHGLTTEGAAYIVMEFLDGPDFASLIVGKDRCLEGKRLRFIRQAAEALAAVHAAGFIHRDICPRNYLLPKGTTDLKLIDFGVTVPALPPFMQPGVRTGNPNYMAPEVVRRKPIDQRLDVFAFGVTAYEFLTHELPWLRGATGMAAMQHDRPPDEITKHRPKVDPTLAKAIYWCLEAEPAKRCPSMEKFLHAIRAVKHEDGAS
jgi:eukaryotic-like serine/threonine-protein kinase